MPQAPGNSGVLIRTYPSLREPSVADAKKRLRRREKQAGEVPYERGAGQRMFLAGMQKGTGRK